MKTRVVALASALVLGAVVGAGGCADNRASVQLQAVCSPPDTCAFTGKCQAQYIGFYAYDRAAAASRPTGTQDTLIVFVQAENQLRSNEDPATGRVDTNGAHVDEIAVDYEGAVTATLEIGTTDYIPSSTTGVVTVPIPIPAGTGSPPTGPQGEVLARIKLRGFYDNGSRFETGDIPLTFELCNSGCAPAPVPQGGCGGGSTCPPASEGQRPLTCVK